MVKVSSGQFILYLLFFFAGFLLLIPKNHIQSIPIQLPLQSISSKPQLPRTFLLNPHILAENKVKIQQKDPELMPAYNNLINQANKLLSQKPVSVMDKSQIPPSGDKHDYMSLSTYSWPNPKTPDGLPYIGYDGKINPEIYSIPDAKNVHTLFSSVNTLALAYFFSGNKKYADKAALFIKTWFIDPKTKMNPNLTYAQIIKGRDNNKGMSGGIIDTANMPQVIDALEILDSSGAFTNSDKKTLQTWFDEYLSWLQSSKSGKYIAQAKNNQRTWYDGQLISIALFLNKPDLAKQIATTYMKNLIPEEINPKGEQPQELARTKSWDYSNFNLQALCNLADLSKNVNVDLWHYQTKNGQSITKAVNFLIPYVTTNEVWRYNQIIMLKKQLIITPLLHAATGLNKQQYWNIGINLLGKNGFDDMSLLMYQKPMDN